MVWTNQQIGFALTIAAAVAFASKTILAKMSYQYGVSPVTLLTLRMLFAGIFFAGILAFNVARGRWSLRLTLNQWLWAFALGIFGYYLSSLLDFIGLLYIDASLGRMILFLYPTIVVLINACLMRQKVPARTIIALAFCYGGIFLMLYPQLGEGQNNNLWLGSGLVFGAALCYASYLVALDRLIKEVEAGPFTSLILVVTAICSVGHFLLTEPFTALTHAPSPVLFNGFLMGTVATVFAIYALTAGIKRLGAPLAAMIGMCGPIITTLMGVFILDERLTLVQVGGMLLILFGVWKVGKSG